jgi:hypothetical protein
MLSERCLDSSYLVRGARCVYTDMSIKHQQNATSVMNMGRLKPAVVEECGWHMGRVTPMFSK